jgi:hypothetical protein
MENQQSTQKQRPGGVIVFAIWSFITSVIVILYGWALFLDGAKGLAAAWGDPPDELARDLWVGYFKTYVAVGLVWAAGGSGYFVSTIGLLKGAEWGRKVSILTIIAISIGWIIIKFVSLRFHLPLPLIGIIIALPMFYLWSGQVRDYCAPAR